MSEVMADGVFTGLEEFFDEEVVDDGDGGAAGVSWMPTPRPMMTWVPTESKYSGLTMTSEAAGVNVGLALDLDAFAPVVVFHGGVGGEADVLDSGDGVEACLDGAVEGLKLRGGYPAA